jgi:hypothetical protein
MDWYYAKTEFELEGKVVAFKDMSKKYIGPAAGWALGQDDWDAITTALREHYQSEEARSALLATGDRYLLLQSFSQGDGLFEKWGRTTGDWQRRTDNNFVGRFLMVLRSEFGGSGVVAEPRYIVDTFLQQIYEGLEAGAM